MARVTVEDCVEKIKNRFDLILVAAQRARALSSGSETSIDRDNDKDPVVSLREIAENAINIEEIEQDLIRTAQRFVKSDDPFGKDDIEEEKLLKELELEAGITSENKTNPSDKSISDADFDEDFAKALETLADQLPDNLSEDMDIKVDE